MKRTSTGQPDTSLEVGGTIFALLSDNIYSSVIRMRLALARALFVKARD